GGLPAITPSAAMPAAPPSPSPDTAAKPVREPASESKRDELKESLGREGRTAGKKMDELARRGVVSREELEAIDAERFLMEDDRKKLGLVRQLYRKLDPTVEWAENNYYKLRIAEQTAGLVTVTPFWVDYARHGGAGPFLSRHLAEASRNFTEMMFDLSVLDLPYDSS